MPQPTGPMPLDATQERRKMHFDRTVSLGNILTIAAMLGGMSAVYSKLESRVAVIESNIAIQQLTNQKYETQLQSVRLEIREELREIRNDQRRVVDVVERNLPQPIRSK